MPNQSPLVLVFPEPQAPRSWEEVHAPAMERGADCKRCSLRDCGRGPVLGTIRPDAPIIAIGEAPGCFLPGTIVLTPTGGAKIEDLRVGDEVLAGNGTYTKVMKTFVRQCAGTVYEVRPAAGLSVWMTDEHPVWNAPMIPPRSGHARRKIGAFSWTQAKAVQRESAVLIPHVLPQNERVVGFDTLSSAPNRSDAHRLPAHLVVDEKTAFVLGLFIGDGSAQVDTKAGVVHWHLNTDDKAAYVKDVSEFLSSIGLAAHKKTENKKLTVTAYSTHLHVFLRELFYDLDGEKVVPPAFLTAPRNIRLAFIRGWYATDGRHHRNENKPRFISSSSPSAVWTLYMMLLAFNVYPTLQAEAPSATNRNKKTNYSIGWRNSDFSALSWGTAHKKKVRQLHTDRSDGFVVPLHATNSKAYNGPVHNIETETNDYCVPYVVHNSNELEAKEGFVGASGKILNDSLLEGGVQRAEISVSNAALCVQPEGYSYGEYVAAVRADYRKQMKRFEKEWYREEDAALSPAKRSTAARKRYEAAASAPGLTTALLAPPPEMPLLPHEACRPRLERDLAESKSLVMLAVGKQALETVAGILKLALFKDRTAPADTVRYANIRQQHGAPIRLTDGRILMSTYHPAFAMREKCEYMPVIKENIARAARIAKRGGAIDWYEPPFILSPDLGLIRRTLHRFLELRSEVTVDIETDGIDPHVCKILCVGLSARVFDEEVVIAVPFNRRNGSPWWDEATKIEIALLVRRVLDELPLVFQNGQYDTTALLRVGLMTNRKKQWTDTLILHHDTPDNDLPHGLGFITRRYFETPLWKEAIELKDDGGRGSDFQLHEYNCKDLVATMRCVEPLRALIDQYGTEPQYETDKKMVVATRDMSELGLHCNEWLRGKFSTHLNNRCTTLIREFQGIVGRKINPRSPPQLRELFYSDWDHVPVIATDGYEWEEEVDELEDGSTSNTALTRLLDERITDTAQRTAIDKLLEFRAVDKTRSVNTDNLHTYPVDWDAHGVAGVDWADPVRAVVYDKDRDTDVEVEVLPRRRGLSLVRTTYKNFLVPTGRLASGDPVNLQNITKNARGGLNLRSLFVAPPGHVLVGADYDQVEARIYAIVAGDALLLDAIHRKLDIHSLNAATLFCKPGENLLDRYRWILDKPKEEKTYVRTVAKRFCIAEGELVLTDRGLVPVENVQISDKLWDGIEWVTHDGVVFQGVKEVIEYDGLRATSDHKVWCADGSTTTFGEAADGRRPIARTGSGRYAIPFLDEHERSLARKGTPQTFRALCLRNGTGALPGQSQIREVAALSLLRDARGGLGRRRQDAIVGPRSYDCRSRTLYSNQQPNVGTLWSAWHRVPLWLGGGSCAVDDRQLWAAESRDVSRPHQQRRALRARQSTLGRRDNEYPQPQLLEDTCRLGVRARRMALPEENRHGEDVRRQNSRRDTRGCTGSFAGQAKELAPGKSVVRVYDILNAGPRRRFTVSNRLVSNCFGLIYGAGADKVYSVMIGERNKGTGERLFPHLELSDCQQWEANWHRLHPETRIWHERCHKGFNTYGFSGVCMLDFRKRFFLGGVAQVNAIPNMGIQGAAASIANRALLAVAEEIPYRGWSYFSGISIQAHDYIGVTVPVSRADEAREILNRCLPYMWEGMKFTATAEVSWDWGAQ